MYDVIWQFFDFLVLYSRKPKIATLGFGGYYMKIFQKNKERGFTLVELLVTIAIIGILAGIAINRFQVSQAQRELNHAALELVSDIRWMQQMSANDATPRMAVIAGTTPLTYSYRLNLWASGTAPQTNVTPNGYRVLYHDYDTQQDTILKEIKFDSDNVQATITVPEGKDQVAITHYAYDLDYTTNDNLENSSYRIQLTHDLMSNKPIYINVDSRVGRVLTTTDVNKGPL